MRRLSNGNAISEARRFKTLTLGRSVGSGSGSGSMPQATAQNQMLIASAVPAWTLLAAPAAQGQVLITGADPYTPAWGTTFPTVVRFDASIELDANTYIKAYDSGANLHNIIHTNDHVITINAPSVAPSEGQLDLNADGIDCLRVTSCAVIVNEGGADMDLRVEASGQPNALCVQGSNGNVGVKTNNPMTSHHVLAGAVANAHYTSFGVQVLERNNAALQIIGEDASTGMAHVVLSGAPATGDNKHWTVAHLGPDASNRFSIGYLTSAATSFSPSVSVDEHFVILTGGNTGFGTTAPNGLVTPAVASAMVKTYDTFTGTAIYIDNSSIGTGSGVYGGGIVFGELNNADHRASAIVGYQSGSDVDASGIVFLVHGATDADDMFEALQINAAGEVHALEGGSMVRLSGTFAWTFVWPEPIVETVGQIRIPWACTVTRVDGNVIGGTSCTLNIEERGTLGSAGTNILSSDMVADANGESVTSSFGNSSLAAGNHLAYDISAVSGAVDFVSLTITGTID